MIRLRLKSLSACLIPLLLGSSMAHAAPQAFGYYTSWSTYGRGFQPEDIASSGQLNRLTVGLYAFAQIGNCASPYATDDQPTLCNRGSYATGMQDYRVYSTDPYSDFSVIPEGYSLAGERGKGNMGKFINTFHSQKKPALLSIGGYTLSVPFFAAIKDENRATFIDSIVTFLNTVKKDNNQNGFDGVDIDWEPNDNGWTFLYADASNARKTLENYVRFATELKKALQEKYVSYAWLTGAFPANPLVINQAEAIMPGFWNRLKESVDYFNIMTYDYHGAFDNPKITNLNAPLYYDENQPASATHRDVFNVHATMQAYKKYLPPSKLVVGIGLYGRAVNGVSNTGHGLYQNFSGVPNGEFDDTGVYDYKFIMDSMIGGKRFEPFKITGKNGQSIGSFAYCETNCPVNSMGDSSGYNTFISYDSKEDAEAKAAYVKSNGFAGVMFWSLDGDTATNRPDSIINSATTELSRKSLQGKRY